MLQIPKSLFLKLFLFIQVIILVVISLESFFYFGLFQNKLHFPMLYILLIALIFSLILKSFAKEISRFHDLLHYKIILIFASISAILFYLDKLVYENFVFSKIHLHKESIVFFTIYTFLLSFFIFNWHKIKKLSGKFLLFLSLNIIAFGANLFFYFPTFYGMLSFEDYPVEDITFVAFLLSSFVCLSLIKKIQVSKIENFFKKISLIILALIALMSFWIAGEEISWGQRIFQIKTPEEISEINVQNEITVHNLKIFQELVYKIYYYFDIYACTSFLVLFFLKKYPDLYRFIRLLSPSPYLILFFLLNFIYLRLRFKYGIWTHRELNETSEMMMALGIFFHFLTVNQNFKKYLKNESF